MENLDIEISEDDVLTVKIDLKQQSGFTKHFNSVRISSTGGNLQIWKNGSPHPAGIRVNLNCFRSLTPQEKQEAKEAYRRAWLK